MITKKRDLTCKVVTGCEYVADRLEGVNWNNMDIFSDLEMTYWLEVDCGLNQAEINLVEKNFHNFC